MVSIGNINLFRHGSMVPDAESKFALPEYMVESGGVYAPTVEFGILRLVQYLT
jgi:hypothetical protein